MRHILLVDVGNSTVKTRVWSCSGGLLSGTSWPTHALPDPGSLLDEPCDGIVMAAVVPAAADTFRRAALRVGIPLLDVTPAHGEPAAGIQGLYASMGADRVANLVGLAVSASLPALCVDAGTAVTLDLLGEGRVWAGGLILPGPELMARALASGTALLPHVEPGSTEILTTETVPSVAAGAHWGCIGMIDGLLRLLKARGCRWRSLVVTGGFAPALSSQLPWDHVVDAHLGFKGMTIVWEALGPGAHSR